MGADPLPRQSVALCMTGALNVEPGFGRFSFTDAGQAAAFGNVFAALRKAGVGSAVFVVVDRVQYHPHPHRITWPWREKVSGRNVYATHELRGCGEHTFCQIPLPQRCNVPTLNESSPQTLPWEGVTANATSRWGYLAEHVELEAYEEVGHCCVNNCTCSST